MLNQYATVATIKPRDKFLRKRSGYIVEDRESQPIGHPIRGI